MPTQSAFAGRSHAATLRHDVNLYYGLAARVGLPPTPFMLKFMGVAAEDLAGRRARDAACWREFRGEVTCLHPSLPIWTLATAPDGQILSSVVERLAYEALRQRLPPSVTLTVHPVLTSDRKWKADFALVASRPEKATHVEVAGPPGERLAAADRARGGLQGASRGQAGGLCRGWPAAAGDRPCRRGLRPRPAAHGGRRRDRERSGGMSGVGTARRYLLRVCAAVTTTSSPPEITEFGRLDVQVEGKKIVQSDEPMSALYRPAGCLPEPEDIAGITEGDLLQRPICGGDRLKRAIWNPAPPDVLVAHDASRIRVLLPPITHMPLPWISTYKIARQIWPWAPGFTLDELVEWRGLRASKSASLHSDRAAARARDTAALLAELLRLGMPLNQLLFLSAVTVAPLLPPPLQDDEIGWRGLPDDELRWLAGAATNLPADVRTRACREKARRIALVGRTGRAFRSANPAGLNATPFPSRLHAASVGRRRRFTQGHNPMATSPDPSETGRRRFHAHQVDTAVSSAVGEVRRRAKFQTLDTDSELIMACAVAADIWRRHDRLFHDPSEFKDDAARAKVAAMLWATVDPALEQVCGLQPTTKAGTAARAAVFLMWDAGEMLARAETGRIMDRLLLAMVLDLLEP